MTPKELFRLGFLMECASTGLSPAQIREKTAALKQSLEKKAIPEWASALWKAPMMAAALPPMAGAAAGAIGGYGLAKLTNEDADPETAKKYELLAAYRQQAERARRQSARLTYRQPSRVLRPTQFP
jgi:hypothetical protein